MPAVATPFVAWHILRGRENCTGGHRCGCRPPAAPDGRHDLDPTLTLHQRVALVRQLDRQWEAS